MTLLYKDQKYHETDAYNELGELIESLRDLGIFQMKSREEAVDTLRHTTLLDSWYESEFDTECLDVEYKHIETTIYFTGDEVYIAGYVDYWDSEQQEEYTYSENWYPEQKEV